jgi:hypothetical protein
MPPPPERQVGNKYCWHCLVWYGMVIYSGLIFILHMLLIFFIDMWLNILSFFHLIYHCIICKTLVQVACLIFIWNQWYSPNQFKLAPAFPVLVGVTEAMDKLSKKDVGRSANHATSNTLWVSGWPDLLHKHNINKTQCNFVNNAQIAVIFVPFNLDCRVT